MENSHISRALAPVWEYVADGVMGGVSRGKLVVEQRDGNGIARLTGRVSLDNDGGFIQMAFDLRSAGVDAAFDNWAGISLELRGNGEAYDIRLRTSHLTRPWQSYRRQVIVPRNWHRFNLPFGEFAPHRTDVEFDPNGLRRVGIVAVGRAFDVDVSAGRVALFR